MRCRISIRVRCKDGESLEITEFVKEHNHEVTQSAYNHLFHQRRLQPSVKQDIQDILKFKPNKRVLQEHIHQTTGKVVILKDIHNLARLSNKESDDRSLKALLTEMKILRRLSFLKIVLVFWDFQGTHFSCVTGAQNDRRTQVKQYTSSSSLSLQYSIMKTGWWLRTVACVDYIHENQ